MLGTARTNICDAVTRAAEEPRACDIAALGSTVSAQLAAVTELIEMLHDEPPARESGPGSRADLVQCQAASMQLLLGKAPPHQYMDDDLD